MANSGLKELKREKIEGREEKSGDDNNRILKIREGIKRQLAHRGLVWGIRSIIVGGLWGRKTKTGATGDFIFDCGSLALVVSGLTDYRLPITHTHERTHHHLHHHPPKI